MQESLGHHLSEQQFLTGYGLAQLVPGPMFTLATYLGAVLLPATPLIGALLATLALFLPGFLLLWALGPCWQHWLARPVWRGRGRHQRRRGGAAAGGPLSAGVAERRALPTDLALAAVGFYLLRVPRLPFCPRRPADGAALLLA